MAINIQLPSKNSNLTPTITVIGVGGAGGNAVSNMIASNLEGVNFVVANTDAQALEHSLCAKRIQLGMATTQGLGAGAVPDVGRDAAEESGDEIEGHIAGSHMLFITAGMGGGTGTGAAPVIAKIAKENDILTVGVVTKPFQFEGAHRMRLAESGITELQKYVDTLIVIPNQNLFRLANERTTFADAFKMADDVLHAGVRGITDLMVMPGLINLDFADIRTEMSEMGKAMMGTGEAEGERRAIDAAESAISNPLLDEISMKGARGVLINITGGPDLTLFEVDEAANRIREEVDPDANIIFGSTYNKDMEGKIRVSVVSTGIESDGMRKISQAQQSEQITRDMGAKIHHPKSQPAKPVVVAMQAKTEAQQEFAPFSQQPAAAVEPVRMQSASMVEDDSDDDGFEKLQPQNRAKPPVDDLLSKLAQRNEDSAYVPPAPAQPKSPAIPREQFATAKPRPRIEEDEDDGFFDGGNPRESRGERAEDRGSSPFSIFSNSLSRMGITSKSPSKSQQQRRNPDSQPAMRSDSTQGAQQSPQNSPRARNKGDDDYLEVPAFLRRQKETQN
jgi:cell division protein FtsZ